MNKIKGLGLSYNPYKKEDKHYFGAFLNLAIININDVLCEFKIRISDKRGHNNKKEIIERHFFVDMSIVEYEKKIAILSDYFPVVDFLDNKLEENLNNRIIGFKTNFLNLLKSIEELRNFYTHYNHRPIEFTEYKQELFTFIDDTLFKTVVKVKNKYLKDDKTKEILKDSLKEEIDRLTKLKLCELEEKKKNDSSFKYSPDPNQIKNSLFNDAFKHLLYENKKSKKKTSLSHKAKSELNDSDIHKESDFEMPLSTSGFVFLLSLFLTKKEIEDLKSNIRGYKGKVVKEDAEKHNSLKYMATHRVYSILSYKGLKYRIKTQEFSKETLMMQMIDELSKVPHCVYKNLDENKKKDFIEDWNEYFKDDDDSNSNFENSYVANPVVRKRYEDKFNYFALRFLDEFANFPTLKFQIYFGNYVHDHRQKTIGTTQIITDRVVKEKINIFGKLSQIDIIKKDFFARLKKEEETKWEIFPNPSYNILKEADNSVANNIPIFLELKNQSIIKEKNNIKSIIHKEGDRKNRNAKKTSKKDIIEEVLNSNTGFTHGDPTAILSLNELPALLYNILIVGKTSEQIEKTIIDKIEKQFNAIKNPTTENKANIPKSILDDANENINYSKLLSDLKKEKEYLEVKKITEFQNRKIEVANYVRNMNNYRFVEKSKRPEIRKYVFYNSEKGAEAVWLANDIKKFMPEIFKKDWKGHEHSELQRLLAFYDKFNKKVILDLLTKCNFDKTVFDIKECFNKDDFEDFYITYLQKRKDLIDMLLVKLDNFKGNSNKLKNVYKSCFIFLKIYIYIKVSKEKIKNRILAMPSFLPRGVFDEKPSMIKGMNPIDNKDEFAGWFVEYLNNNDYQKFYDKETYQINSNFKTNAVVKKQKIKDFYTLQMVNNLMSQVFDKDEKLKLSELFQSRAERIQLQDVAKMQTLKRKGDSSENIRNQTYIWNKNVAMSFFDGKISVDNVKLKNIGKYRKHERDSRVKTLLKYEENINWKIYLPHNWKEETDEKPVNVIDIQIQEYEQIRCEKLFKEIQQLEKYIYENSNNENDLLRNNNPNFTNYILNGLLKQIKNINITEFSSLKEGVYFKDINLSEVKNCNPIEQKAIILIAIRNKFAHNQFPNKDIYDLTNTILPIEEKETYANYYFRIMQYVINDLMEL